MVGTTRMLRSTDHVRRTWIRQPIVLLVFLTSAGTSAVHAELTWFSAPDDSATGFGTDVASVPDVNGNGIDDFAVRRYPRDLFVYEGSTQELLHRIVIAPSTGDSWNRLGHLCGLPDTNGDGLGDIAIARMPKGPAFVFNGNNGDLLHTLECPQTTSTTYGDSISGIPDVNGDGLAEIVVGDPDAHYEADRQNRVYVFDGSTGDVLYSFGNIRAMFVWEKGLSAIPDTNGDGIHDILAVTRDQWSFPSHFGFAAVFDGSDGSFLHTLTPALPTSDDISFLGRYAFGLPDMNGNGSGDALVFARAHFDPTNRFLTRWYLLDGSTGALIYMLSYAPVCPGEESYKNISFSAVPDMNGDSIVELAITNTQFAGLYIFDGASGVLLYELRRPPDGHPRLEDFGHAVAGIPDVNGDGLGDLLIGSPLEDSTHGLRERGRVYLFTTGDPPFEGPSSVDNWRLVE